MRKKYHAYDEMRARQKENEKKLAKEREVRAKRYPWLNG